MPLSDILACPKDEVEFLIQLEEPYSKGKWYMAKNIGTIELSQLGEILNVNSYKELSGNFNLVGEPLDEGPWPQTIPLELIEKLHCLPENEMASASDKWSKIEEFLGSANPEDLKQYLIDLQMFIKENQNDENQFFLVNAL